MAGFDRTATQSSPLVRLIVVAVALILSVIAIVMASHHDDITVGDPVAFTASTTETHALVLDAGVERGSGALEFALIGGVAVCSLFVLCCFALLTRTLRAQATAALSGDSRPTRRPVGLARLGIVVPEISLHALSISRT